MWIGGKGRGSEVGFQFYLYWPSKMNQFILNCDRSYVLIVELQMFPEEGERIAEAAIKNFQDVGTIPGGRCWVTRHPFLHVSRSLLGYKQSESSKWGWPISNVSPFPTIYWIEKVSSREGTLYRVRSLDYWSIGRMITFKPSRFLDE